MKSIISNFSRLSVAPSKSRFSINSINHRSYSRLADFYNNTLRDDLTILQYNYKSEKLDQYINEKNLNELSSGSDSSATADVSANSNPNSEVSSPIKKKALTETERLLNKNVRKIPGILDMDGLNSARVESVTVHIRMKEALGNKNNILSGLMALQCITGERPEVVKARSDAAAWKLRKGMPISAKVTLTGESMYIFIDKLVETVLPRLKEWDGLKVNSGDGLGNFSLGFTPAALGLFTEIEAVYDMFPIIYGLMVNIKTTARRNSEGRLLLSGLKLPFVVPRPRAAPPKRRSKRSN
ncbi:putative 54S ribosomal protein L7, mitochondrial [Smittium culicis]|uniref:Putative 54S ribosomal protein L7, mitochondrial n=1 Tax=Smittium culicis TaxID=133412 RepID=A0A1R1XVM0_9FUNG|nr:putative 54S ribosomal protein L7, mitochondrial [Smittium culicis]OMJ25388.1 putative 54S ribosomal protein L7, mitochondrial [Smittium culicis]